MGCKLFAEQTALKNESEAPALLTGAEGSVKQTSALDLLMKYGEQQESPEKPRTELSDTTKKFLALAQEQDDIPKGSSFLRNAIGGILAGNITGGTSSWETLATGMVDLGRLFAKDAEGNRHLWMSTPEAMDLDQETWDKMDTADKRVFYTTKKLQEMKETWKPDDKAAAYMAGEMMGWIFTDPLSYLPIVGQTTKARAAIGAGVGATSAAGYSAVTEGEVNPTMVAAGAVLAGGAVAGLDKLSKGMARKTAGKRLNALTEEAAKRRIESKDAVEALEKAKMVLGYTDEHVAKFVEVSKRTYSPESVLKTEKDARGFLKSRQLEKERFEHSLVGKPYTSAKNWASELVLPTSEVIRSISPRIHQKLNSYFSKNLDYLSESLTSVHPYNNMMNKMKRNNEFMSRYGAHDVPAMHKMMKQEFGDEAVDTAYKSFRKVLDDQHAAQIKLGRKIPYIKDYHPFHVNDYDKLRKALGDDDVGLLDTMLKKKAQELHGKNAGIESLSEGTRNEVVKHFITPHVTKGGKVTPGSAKERTISKRNLEMLKAYSSPGEAVVNYLKKNIEDVNRQILFGKPKVAAKAGKKLSATEVDDMMNSNITELVAKETQKGAMSNADAVRLRKALEDIFIAGKRAPHRAPQFFRNLTYAGTIANPRSALTQLGDIALAGMVNGWDNLFTALYRKFRGTGLSAKEWGFGRHISEELLEKGTSHKVMHNLFRWSGFTSVDLMGKTAVINSSLAKYQKLAKKGEKALYRELGTALTDAEIKQFAKEVATTTNHKSASDLVKSVLFADLAKIQPISIMEMPGAYIRNPDWRMAYTLRTFSIKFVNLLRRQMVDDFRKGHVTRGLTKAFALYSMHTVAETGVEVVKRTLIDMDPDEAAKLDEIAIDKALQATGVFSRYSFTDTTNPLSSAAAALLPVASVYDPHASIGIKLSLGQDISDDLTGRAWRRFPIIGPLIEPWYTDIYHRSQQEQGRDY